MKDLLNAIIGVLFFGLIVYGLSYNLDYEKLRRGEITEEEYCLNIDTKKSLKHLPIRCFKYYNI